MDAVIEPAAETIRITSHRQYHAADQLSPQNVPPNPLELFRVWFKEAHGGTVLEPEAMALSTATAAGIPSTRFVLLKEVDARGFIFFTNYDSRKSKEIQENPHASISLYWRELHRQVRAVGKVEKISKQESYEYFKTRPLGSRIGAWASPQSSVITENELPERFVEFKDRFSVADGEADKDIPIPDYWGGWRIVPL